MLPRFTDTGPLFVIVISVSGVLEDEDDGGVDEELLDTGQVINVFMFAELFAVFVSCSVPKLELM